MFSLSKSIFRVNFLNARILGVFLCPIWGMPPYFFPHGFIAFSDICKCFEKVSELALPSVHR